MRGTILVLCVVIFGCDDSSVGEQPDRRFVYTLDRSIKFTLVPPIPPGDKWLETYKSGHGFSEGWETWVWRKTDIWLGDGITVFAREEDEQQFLVMGLPELDKICIDFRHQGVGEEWSFGATHIGSLTPSGEYVVVITEYPRSYLPIGMSLKERYKTDRGWDFEFQDNIVTWWKRES